MNPTNNSYNPDQLSAQLKKCVAPATEALSLPPECYTSEAVLQAELTAIFRRNWIGIGHAGRFKAAGDYESLTLGGVPLIVLRDKAGNLRAFANSCRHRGAQLLEGEGNCGMIKCPFHKWAYKLDGTLAGVPQIDDFNELDRSQYGLIEFRAAEACGFGFVCLDNNAPALGEQIGDFADLHSPWPLETLVPTKRRSFEVNCNWKAFLEVFNEYYHLPYVHPSSINSLYAKPDAADIVTGAYASQYGGTDGSGALLEDQQDQVLPPMPDLDPSVRNGVRYTWVFPNMSFALGSDALWMYEAAPIDAHRCYVTQTACFPRQTTEAPNFPTQAQQYYHRLDEAIDEDIPALENQQQGLNSPFARQGPFSALLEANVASFANWYAQQLLDA
ncbi:MAG: aromatic ring-hydroxylating dioxygenase subunit alpha [Chloroflexota bacterium]